MDTSALKAENEMLNLRIAELEARHDNFLKEFWKTNADNERLRAEYQKLYEEANSWLTPEAHGRIQLLDQMHEAALKEGEGDEWRVAGALDETLDEIERLTAEGARKWISVEDHLPNDRQSVLVHDERHKHSLGGTVFVRMYFPKSRKPWGDHLGITHWMPLPSAPVSGRQLPEADNEDGEQGEDND